MELLIPPFIFASLITIIAIFPTIKLAKKYGLVDDPNKRPHPAHIQMRIVPRAGGLPIFIGLLFSILFFIPLDKHIWGIIIGSLVLLIIGLIDDYKTNLSPFPRLGTQFFAAIIVVLSGVGISFVTNPLGGTLPLDSIIYPINFLGNHSIVLFADIFALFWIVWMMNMVNWSEGVDGQLTGMTTIVGIIIGILSYKFFALGDVNQLSIAQLSFITAGVSFGFLIFNWHPAKIFASDSGANILGFMIAVLSILSGAKLATALIVLLLPATDFFYTFFRRILTGKSPFHGDKKHLHHLLLARGWSHQQISLFYILSCAILGAVASVLSSQGKLFVVIAAGVIILGTILWLHLLYQENTQKMVKK